jgi:hypothetical protein
LQPLICGGYFPKLPTIKQHNCPGGRMNVILCTATRARTRLGQNSPSAAPRTALGLFVSDKALDPWPPRVSYVGNRGDVMVRANPRPRCA